jgi:hypothetical protein
LGDWRLVVNPECAVKRSLESAQMSCRPLLDEARIMHTIDLSNELAKRVETCEVNAWVDMYQALPAKFAEQFGFALFNQEGLVQTCCKAIPFVHFNCVKNLGLGHTATQAQLEQALAIYSEREVTAFSVLYEPHRLPSQLPQWLKARGLTVKGSWDRILRISSETAAFQSGVEKDYLVEKVDLGTASRWAAFIDKTYGLPNSPWLTQLVGRPGWQHYLLSRAGRDVCARSMFMDKDGSAWFCIDAPVPGVMGPSFDDDARLCEVMVNDGLALGVNLFVADIEMPTPEKNSPAYANFAALGFKHGYLRELYGY